MKAAVGKRQRPVAAVAVMAAVAVYRPLVLWAHNPWDLAAPQELFLFSAAILGLQVGVFIILSYFGVSDLASTVLVAGSTLVLMFWRRTPLTAPWAWLILILGLAVVLHIWGRTRWLIVTAAVSLGVLAIAPAIQVALAHFEQSEAYPIVDLAPRRKVEATGLVEDVLVVIVDSYPSPQVARTWFDHDPDLLVSNLRTRGLTVPNSGWSHHTFTYLAIPSVLELQPVMDPSSVGSWGNRRSAYELIRGNNLVATTLRSAGFNYTHIESGWDGGHCGHGVDHCETAPWFRESTWLLLQPSVLAPSLISRYGNTSVPGSRHTISSLLGNADRFDDGKPDYVFAHLLLPHAPIVVDEDCRVVPNLTEEAGTLDPVESQPESRVDLSSQMACVDALLSRAVTVIGDRTAVLITGDHGPGSNGQMLVPPDQWSDADIAERLGVLLAYKVPDGCPQPATDSNLEAMRSIMTCAVDIEPPVNHGMHVLGANDPVWVEPTRMARIKDLMARGEIGPDSG